MNASLIAVGGFILTAIILPLLLSELIDWCPKLAERILNVAARNIPLRARPEQLRQWLGDVHVDVPGRLSKIVVALHILLTSPATGRARAGDVPAENGDWRAVEDLLRAPLRRAVIRGARPLGGVGDAVEELVQQAFTQFKRFMELASPDLFLPQLPKHVAERTAFQLGMGLLRFSRISSPEHIAEQIAGRLALNHALAKMKQRHRRTGS